MTSEPYVPDDGSCILRRDLGEHAERMRYLDLVPLTFGRARVCRSDGRMFYGESY